MPCRPSDYPMNHIQPTQTAITTAMMTRIPAAWENNQDTPHSIIYQAQAGQAAVVVPLIPHTEKPLLTTTVHKAR